MRHLSIIACWHLNYDKISGVDLIKVVSVGQINNKVLMHDKTF